MNYFLDKTYAIADHTIINYAGDNVKLRVPDKIGNITIRSIGEGAFMELPYLQYVMIPAHVTSIGEGAFRSNRNLRRAVLSGGIERIGKHAFFNCKELSEIKVYDYLIDEKDYYELKNNSIRASGGVYVARKIPEIPIVKDLIGACDVWKAHSVPDGVNRLFYTNYFPTDGEHQLRNRNVNNIGFLNYSSSPITEDQGVMECLKTFDENLSIIKADEINDGYLRVNKRHIHMKTAVFSFDDKETKDVNGKKKISMTLRFGYFFFQSLCRLVCNGTQYYVYRRYYLTHGDQPEFLRMDVAIYTDKGLVTSKEEAQTVYAKYKFLCIL